MNHAGSGLVNEVAVSSFSLRQEMGAVTFRSVGAGGEESGIELSGSSSLTVAAFASRAREAFSVDLIEICQVQLGAPDEREIEQIAAAMTSGGVRLLGMPIDVGDIGHPLAEVRERSVIGNERWFDVAARLGARYVRVNGISPLERSGEAAPRTVAAEGLRRLSESARERGMQLLLENKGGMANYPELLVEVLDELGSETVGLILDTGNVEPLAGAMIARLRGIEPDADSELGLTRAYEVIRMLAPYATVVHAKAHGFDREGVQGPMDLAHALGILRTTGFDGPVTIEYEGISGDPWLNTRRTVAIVRSVFAA